MNDAKEPLLPQITSDALRPSTSLEQPNKLAVPNRFHVSKSGTETTGGVGRSILLPNDEVVQLSNDSPGSERANERKSSAAGRFLVNEVTETSSAPLKSLLNATSGSSGISRTPSPEAVDSVTYALNKSVHFSVGNEANNTLEDESGASLTDREGNTTVNMKSWRHIQTLEHPPMIDFYRDSIDALGMNSRPSMNQLIHGEKGRENVVIGIEEFKNEAEEIFDGQITGQLEKFKPPTPVPRTKFGWVQGVFVRCLLNIFGVMLYLRVSWVAGEAGILLGSLVVILASVVTTLTAISTCAICTNGDVKGGGAYFLISRSLGPEFGGSIGMLFAFANAVGAAMYVVGFAETVRDLMQEYGVQMIDGDMNDVRVVGLVTCTLLMAVVFVGTSFESKMQIGLLAILTASIINYFIGTVIPISEHQASRGITGYSFTTMMSNLLPAFTTGETFFSVFAVYFPAATGIMAGANISGDLADPQNAIPLGTLLAIVVTTIIYLLIVVMTGSTCVRYADGVSPYLVNGSIIEPDCAMNNTCRYGLMNYFQVMEMESLWGPLITAGIFAATLSSALASLVSAPKIFQAVCKDRLFPKIDVFAKGYGRNEEPRRAYGLAFLIAMVMILIGRLNAIAPIISNFFLASYALINYACFDASFANSPGFRPRFRHYNKWLSLTGAILCISVMFIISWSTALLTFFIFAVIFLYILHRKPDVNWGSSTQAHSYKSALQAMIKLSNTEEHVKNYRPQILVLTGNPVSRPSLVDFVYSISKGSSLMICGYVIPYEPCDRVYCVTKKLDRQLNEWLKKRHVKSFYNSVANPSLRNGVQNLIQISGLGKLRPNILILGFKTNWAANGAAALDEINDYFGVIQDAFENNMGVGVLRNVGGGLDYSELMKRHNVGDTTHLNFPDVEQHLSGTKMNMRSSSDSKFTSLSEKANKISNRRSAASVNEAISREEHTDIDEQNRDESSTSFGDNYPLDYYVDPSEEIEEEKQTSQEDVDNAEELGTQNSEAQISNGNNESEKRADGDGKYDVSKDHSETATARYSLYEHMSLSLLRRRGSRRPTAAQRELLASISRFQRKIKRGTIDVWWLYDDGGLTLLVPHLLTNEKSYLENARLRVFTIATSHKSMEQEQRSMAALLSKFRIDFSDVSVIPDIGRKPSSQTKKEFEDLIAPFRIPNDTEERLPGLITDSELISQKEKTNRQLRTAELLRQHSIDADLVVLTLPVPRKGLVSSCLYMAWLDMMTRDLPPTLLIRGNQTSVLTFYS